MRPVEIVLLAAVVLAAVTQLGRGRWPWRAGRGWAAIGLALAVLHVVLEGARVPMGAAYLLVAVMVLVAWLARCGQVPRRSRIRATARWAGGLVVLALVVVPPWLFPVFRLPAPGGPHAVGSTWFAWTDTARQETLGPAPAGARAIMVRAWYPAPAGTEGELAPYALHRTELTGGILGLIRLGPLVGGQLDYVATHSYRDAPLAPPDSAGWPVLVFSHGYTGFSAQNTPQMEDLASRGYVVLSISHTHDAGGTIFPDGRVVGLDPAILAMFRNMGPMQDSLVASLAALESAATPEARQAAFRRYTGHNEPRIMASVPVWAADTRHVLDRLEQLEPGEPGGRFAGALDLDRVGIFGMSFGGSNAGEVCRVDGRCKAGINIDGQQFGPLVLEDSLTVPFMIMASNTAVPVHRAAFDRLRGPGYLVLLRGTEHLGLTDTPFVAPHLLRWMGLTGTMPVARTEALMTEYIGAFFDRHLKGLPAPVLDGAAPPDDVDLVRVGPAG